MHLKYRIVINQFLSKLDVSRFRIEMTPSSVSVFTGICHYPL